MSQVCKELPLYFCLLEQNTWSVDKYIGKWAKHRLDLSVLVFCSWLFLNLIDCNVKLQPFELLKTLSKSVKIKVKK